MVTVDFHMLFQPLKVFVMSPSMEVFETAGGSFREDHDQSPNSTLCQRNPETM